MNRLFRMSGAACLVLAVFAASPERTAAMESPVLAAADVLPLIVHHNQGWGRLGIDTCTYGAGSEPMSLQIGDKHYDKGLGLHAPGETWLALNGQYAWFEAEVGVQQQPQDQGSVVFRVYGDDKLLFDSGVLRESDRAKALRVPVEGVANLRLEYDDAGDGFACDCANWVNLRLTPSASPTSIASGPGLSVDIAAFGKVLTWNPYVKDGTHAARTEEFPGRDLFPGKEVRPVDGAYAVPMLEHPHADIGMGCIGLEWLEQRRVQRAELHFANDAPSPDGAAVEYWAMTPDFHSTPGVSRWQGHWEHLNADIMREGRTWSVEIPRTTHGWQRPTMMKLRWLIPRDLGKERIERLSAYSDSFWKDVDLTIHAVDASVGEKVLVSAYNGVFIDGEATDTQTEWKTAEPLRVRVRSTVERPWSRSERTVLRFDLAGQDFGIAVSDVLSNGSVYVETAGVVAMPAESEETVDACIEKARGGKTILEAVRTMPDQSLQQAIEHVHRPEADYGPTLLSLAHGNEKFLLQRNGSIGFDAPGKYDGQKRGITVSWEGQSEEGITRHLDGGWMPIPVIGHEQNGVSIQQCTFVAPTGHGPAKGMADWYDDQPLCVAAYTFTNQGDTPGAATLTLGFRAAGAAAVAPHAKGAVFTVDGEPCALLNAGESGFLTVSAADAQIQLKAALDPGQTAQCALYIPGWDTAPAALPSVDAVPSLLETTQAHWNDVMAGTARITTPNVMLNNLIMASRVHCMLAARNEEGKRIAPWIGSIHYGPLESEAHSLVRGMAFLGHDDFARRGLDFFINRYNDDGYLTTGYTVIGTGWHLWALGEYFALSENSAWLRENASEVNRVCQWILAQREKTQQKDAFGQPYPEAGLMPPGVLADWGVYSHYFYLNGNYYAGLKWTGEALAAIGWDNAGNILDQAAAFRGDIQRAFRHVQGLAPVLPLRDDTWVPAYPTQLYCPMPIADMYAGDDAGRSWCYDVELGAHHLVPMGVLDPEAPSVGWMMDHMEDVQFLESGWFYYPKEENHEDWFNLGGFAKVQPFYARNAEVNALRDDVKPFIRNYFNAVVSLLNREDLSLWEHFMNGAFNKTHETGYFLHQSRLMFVMERDNTLWLAPFVPAEYVADGQTVDVADVPTSFGPVSYRIDSHLGENRMEARVDVPRREAPEEVVVRMRHPEGGRISRAEVEGGTLLGFDADEEIVRVKPGGEDLRIIAWF